MKFKTIVAIACAILVHATMARGQATHDRPDSNRIIAIDVLLVPDATMTKKAEAANARLRGNYPQGYTLGSAQAPHITLVHRYVREKDLPAIETAVAKLADAAKPLDWQLVATEFTSAVWAGVAITTIGIERTPKLDRLQEEVVKAVEPFAVMGGTASAFSTTRELPKIDPDIVNYVEHFITNASGKKYNPHVTIGVAHEDFVKKLKDAPFEKFTFQPATVAIDQLGNFGTAQKKLWEWKPQSGKKK